MRIPGFNAEASLAPSTRKYRGQYAPDGPRGTLTPAYAAASESFEGTESAYEMGAGEEIDELDAVGDETIGDELVDDEALEMGADDDSDLADSSDIGTSGDEDDDDEDEE